VQRWHTQGGRLARGYEILRRVVRSRAEHPYTIVVGTPMRRRQGPSPLNSECRIILNLDLSSACSNEHHYFEAMTSTQASYRSVECDGHDCYSFFYSKAASLLPRGCSWYTIAGGSQAHHLLVPCADELGTDDMMSASVGSATNYACGHKFQQGVSSHGLDAI